MQHTLTRNSRVPGWGLLCNPDILVHVNWAREWKQPARCGLMTCLSALQLYGVDKKSILHKVELPNFQSSTKLEALMEELHLMQVPGGHRTALHLHSTVDACLCFRHNILVGSGGFTDTEPDCSVVLFWCDRPATRRPRPSSSRSSSTCLTSSCGGSRSKASRYGIPPSLHALS